MARRARARARVGEEGERGVRARWSSRAVGQGNEEDTTGSRVDAPTRTLITSGGIEQRGAQQPD